MKSKKTLFQHLHDTLVLEIVSGKLMYGEKLPALRSLCEIYNVGIRTVRDVMRALIEEGYVESVQRSHIRVVYQANGTALKQAESVLAKKNSIIPLLKMLGYIMPYIYIEASKLCDAETIQLCRNDIAGISELTSKEQWRLSRIPLQRIIAVFNNSLLQDLYVDIDLFSQLAIVPGFDNPYQEILQDVEKGLNQLFDKVAYQDYDAIYSIIYSMYQSAANAVAAYFDKVQDAYPEANPEPISFYWNAEKGRLRTYMQVMRNIVKNIKIGVYEDGSYMPTNSQLCKEYQVSAYTIGNVIEELDRIGLIKQTNDHGRYVITCQKARTKDIFINGSTPCADAITYLSALHLTALISKGLAALCFPFLDRNMIEALSKRVDNMESLSSEPGLLYLLIHTQPYEPLITIYRQLVTLLDWGYHFSFAFDDKPYMDAIKEKNKIVVSHLYNNNKIAFIETFQGIYYYIFRIMQKNICDFGATDARNIRLP